jgi:hypothetical protein
MREADRNEVWASHRHTPLEALSSSFKRSSLVWTINHEGMPVAMFGVASMGALCDTGYPWLLGTDKMYEIIIEFLRWSRYYVQKMQEPYERLENWVDVRNTKSARWLKWCGFTLEEPKPWGFDKLPFSHFTMEQNNV